MSCFGKTADREKNKEINRTLRDDAQYNSTKLLLLGTGDSGKTTFTKQTKLLYCGGFAEKEITEAKDMIRNQVLLAISSLASALVKTKKSKLSKSELNTLMQLGESPFSYTTCPFSLLQKLKSDKALTSVLFDNLVNYQLDCNTRYYLANLERILTDDYNPSTEDVLHIRLKTSGIIQTDFTANNQHFSLIDVGGQRSERRRWLNCFEDVAAILYLVNLAEYDLLLMEDYRVNRLHESLELFQEVTSSSFFEATTVCVVFNKEDLFKEKIKISKFSELFEDYDGNDDYDSSIKYIMDHFKRRFGGDSKCYHTFVSCGLDASSVEKVIASVQTILKDIDINM